MPEMAVVVEGDESVAASVGDVNASCGVSFAWCCRCSWNVGVSDVCDRKIGGIDCCEQNNEKRIVERYVEHRGTCMMVLAVKYSGGGWCAIEREESYCCCKYSV